jgi:methylated-DNA-[protein]-cysteine S-methyltransferase
MYTTYMDSEIGIIEITGTEEGIESVSFIKEKIVDKSASVPDVLIDCVLQLEEYFEGKRKSFDLKLNMKGTDFQVGVWKELLLIPFGKTVSYSCIAEILGDVKKVRAVGSANGKNKISVIVPCHRVIGSNGELTGYAGGLWRKEWLLKHEGVMVKGREQMELF